MNKPVEHSLNKAVDSIQESLTDYAYDLKYHDVTPAAVHATKVRVIDTLGAVIGGFFSKPSRIARDLAAQMPTHPGGATVIGTRMKTMPDMAAFVNATTARSVELNDCYLWPASSKGHPSDTLTPVLAVAEYMRLNGREFITGVVLAYEVFLRFSDVAPNPGFDNTNFACLATAMASGKLLGLSRNQISHCISMAVVPNNILSQVRKDHLTMFKAAAAGQAGRAGVFAALLARAGMEGPHLPFEGKAGWCEHVAGKTFSLDTMGGNGTPFKILDSYIKPRPSCGNTISSILAAEKVAPLKIQEVKQVTVEVYKKAHHAPVNGEDLLPNSREMADHSIPYVVAATLMDGTITLRSFNDAHLRNPELRALMQRIEVVADEEFTRAFERQPQEHRTRVTVLTNSGERLVGEAGSDSENLPAPKTDAQIEKKFREYTEDYLGVRQVSAILDRLWHLEELEHVAEIPPAFIVD